MADGATTLPLTIRQRRGRVFWRILQVIVFILCVLVLSGSGLDPTDEPLLVVIAITAGLILLFEIVLRWRGRVRDRIYTIDRDGVRFATGRESWAEPLAAYDGVLWREEVRRSGGSGGSGGSHRVWILELRCPGEASHTVPLLEKRSETGVRARWEALARALDLPALRDVGGGEIQQRAPDDLDLSVRQRAAKGRLDGPAEIGTIPPKDVEWNPRDAREARIRQHSGARAVLFAFSFIPALGGLIAFWGHDQQLPLLLLATPLFGHAYRVAARYRIAAVDDRLELALEFGPLRFARRRFPIDDIEQIWTTSTGPAELGVMRIKVESDARSASLALLSRDTGDWTAAFIRHLASAPKAR